jgi:hypothetical protein
MEKEYLFIVFFGGLALIFIALFWLRVIRKDKITPKSHGAPEIYETLPNYFEGSVSCSSISSWLKGPLATFKGKFEGYEFSLDFRIVTYFVGRFYLTLYSDYESKLNIFVYTGNRGLVFFAKKIKTGFQNFDKQFVIYSNNPNKAKQIFYDDVNRNSLIRIKGQGWAPPHIVKNKITTDRTFTYKKWDVVDHILIEETLRDMIIFSKNIKKHVLHTQ